jgi:DNA-binding NarL/FixJ family response regulator
MAEWLAVMTLISTGLLLALWIWDRMLFAQKLQELAGRQLETSRTLNEFILESGRIAQEFARLLPQATSPVSVTDSRENREPRKRGPEKRHMVLDLARKGLSTREISQQLKVPKGEIDLIVSLNHSRAKQVSA